MPTNLVEAIRGRLIVFSLPGEAGRPPIEVRATCGTEITFSLQTDDRALTANRQAAALAQAEAFFAAARIPAPAHTEEDAARIRDAVRLELIQEHRANPRQTAANFDTLTDEIADALRWYGDCLSPDGDHPTNPVRGEQMLATIPAVVDALERHAPNHRPEDRAMLLEAVGLGFIKAGQVITQMQRGDYSNAPSAPLPSPPPASPPLTTAPVAAITGFPVTYREIFAAWEAEHTRANGAPGTRPQYRSLLERFSTRCGKTDARLWGAQDIRAWVDARLADGISRRTVLESDVPALRTMLQSAFTAGLLPENAAQTYRSQTRRLGRGRSVGQAMEAFTDEEARTILAAAQAERAAYRRWVPWLCALSGSRVSPIMNLRHQDIQQQDGVWLFRVERTAGPIKTDESERAVPIHPRLIKDGFLAFVETRKGQRLFYDGRGMAGANPGKPRLNHLRNWLHAIAQREGLRIGRAHRKDPNHAWRHWFISRATVAGLTPEVRNAIVGHASGGSAGAYLHLPIGLLASELAKVEPPCAATP